MGARGVGGEDAVHRQDRPDVEIHAAAQVTLHRGEVAANPLERELEPVEGGVVQFAAGDELVLEEPAKRLRIPVRGPPRPEHLRDALVDPRRFRGARRVMSRVEPARRLLRGRTPRGAVLIGCVGPAE